MTKEMFSNIYLRCKLYSTSIRQSDKWRNSYEHVQHRTHWLQRGVLVSI